MPKKRSNGEGTLRRRTDGRWESAIMDGYRPDGKPKVKYFYGKTQKEVKEKVRAWEANRASGIDASSDFTFRQWSDIWYEGHRDNVTPTTQESYKYTLRILQDFFGPRKISEVKPYDVEEFLKKLRRDGRSDSYLAGCRGMFYQIFHKAEANDLVRKNPVRFAEKMRSTGPRGRKEAFTAEEVKRLMDLLPEDRMGNTIRIMLGTGMRTKEILALEPCHIEPDGSEIHIRQAINMIKGTAVVGAPKSRDSYRDVPIPESLQHYAVQLRDTKQTYIWSVTKADKPCNPSYFRDKFKEALEEVGGVRILTPHSCRHTYISQMQNLGVDLSTIQSIVGHADVDMTQHYLHVQKPIRLDAVSRFSAAFAPAVQENRVDQVDET